MEDKHPQQLLGNPEQEPTDELLKGILDKPIYDILNKIGQHIVAAGLALEWRYYKDGKAWLGKVTYKKKPLFGYLFGKSISQPGSILPKNPSGSYGFRFQSYY